MTVKIVARDRVLPFQFAGLLPLTKHYLYIDTERAPDNQIKPYGGMLGDALITDANGNLVFDYYRVTGAYDVTNYDQANVVNRSRIAKRRRYVICNVYTTSLDASAESVARSSAALFF